jgi:hypothetical protein
MLYLDQAARVGRRSVAQQPAGRRSRRTRAGSDAPGGSGAES